MMITRLVRCFPKRQMTTTTSLFRTRKVDGIEYEIASLESKNADSPLLAVFVHGNGLCKETYRKMIEEVFAIAPRDRTIHTISIDLVGHGGSSIELAKGRTKISEMTPDIEVCIKDFLQSHQVGHTCLVGHSVGAHAALLAHLKMPLFQSAFLIEPMIREGRFPAPDGLVEKTKRRRTTFENREAAMKYFTTRGIFQLWEHRCIEDYVDHGLHREDPAKPELTLNCPIEVEVGIFSTDISEVYPELGNIKLEKVEVLAGDKGAYLPPGHLEHIASLLGGKCKRIQEGHHVLQCERPAATAEDFVSFIRDLKI